MCALIKAIHPSHLRGNVVAGAVDLCSSMRTTVKSYVFHAAYLPNLLTSTFLGRLPAPYSELSYGLQASLYRSKGNGYGVAVVE